MTTRVTFNIDSDDEDLRAAIADIKDDPVMTWRLAVFVANQLLERALAARAIRDHYDAIHFRARATRAAKQTGGQP